MASIQIKNRTAKNLNPKFIDFSVTPIQGNSEVNFFICSAFYPSALAFYPSAPTFYPSASTFYNSGLDAESIPD